MADFQRAYDDKNHKGGIDVARATGFMGAFVPRFQESRLPSGDRWTLQASMQEAPGGALGNLDEGLARLKNNKATSLLPVSKEMIQMLDSRGRTAFAHAHAVVACSREDGDAHGPGHLAAATHKLHRQEGFVAFVG